MTLPSWLPGLLLAWPPAAAPQGCDKAFCFSVSLQEAWAATIGLNAGLARKLMGAQVAFNEAAPGSAFR
jgi:hypothetical protein